LERNKHLTQRLKELNQNHGGLNDENQIIAVDESSHLAYNV